MRRTALLLALAAALLSCSGKKPDDGPVSIRGWIADVQLPNMPVTTPQEAGARLMQILNETTVSVENVPYASGGVSNTGSFIILDVPPGDSIIVFNAPGVPNAQLKLQGMPPSADVLLPGLLLHGEKAELREPDKAVIRVPSESSGPRRKIASQARINGLPVEVWEVPLSELTDRRDYPDSPLVTPAPVPVVR